MRYALLALLALAACGDNYKPGVPQDAGIDADKVPCGNGVVEGVEECDDGPQNGVEGARCMTSAVGLQGRHVVRDTELCNGTETCVDHRCVAGTAAATDDLRHGQAVPQRCARTLCAATSS